LPPSAEPGGPPGGAPATARGGTRRRSGVALAVAALALGAILVLWRSRERLAALDLRGAAASPETQVKDALARTTRVRLDGLAGGAAAALSAVRFAEAAVSVEGPAARVLAVVEAEGVVERGGERIALSYVGREAFRMAPCAAQRWCPEGEPLPALRGVLDLLLRRAAAFQARDPEAYAPLVSDRYPAPGGKPALLARLRADLAGGPPARLAVLAFQLRVERGRAVAGEDDEVQLGGAAPARLRARYALALEGERWLIVDGL